MGADGEIYFESIRRSVKVPAIDAASGTEVSVIAPRASQAQLQRLALQKLKARLANAD